MTQIAVIGSGLVADEVFRIAPSHLPRDVFVTHVPTEACLAKPRRLANFDLAILCGSRSEAVAAELGQIRTLKLIDVSPTFRADPAWTYGFREFGGVERIQRASRVANPGCVATAAVLALRPLTQFLLPGAPLYLDVVGGSSMAGSKPGQASRISALDSQHPHIREIERTCGLAATGTRVWLHPKVDVSYERGILLAAPLIGLDAGQALEAWRLAYVGEKDVIVESGFDRRSVHCGFWAGRAGAWLTAIPEEGGCTALVCLDNLLKGAAETALRNAASMLKGDR